MASEYPIAEDAAARRRRRDARLLDTAGAFWLVVVTVFFLWQAASYRGVVAILGEWQFDWTGRYYPTLTTLALLLLFAVPGLTMLGEAERRRARYRLDDERRKRGGPAVRALNAIAVGFLFAAIGALVLTLRLPSGEGAPRLIRADLAAPADLAAGPAVLVGRIDYLRTAALDEDVWVSKRSSLFAPIGVGGARPTVRFFTELDRGAHADPAHPVEIRRGILKRDALPGELVRLYRYAGLDVARPYWVLYADRATMRWPYLAVAAELAIVAVVLALAAGLLLLFQRRERAREHS